MYIGNKKNQTFLKYVYFIDVVEYFTGQIGEAVLS